MNFFINCLKGIAIGSGAILPGISSGVLCLIFGIYETLLNSILDFFNDIKKNSKFLFPIVLGGLLGILIFSNILNYLLFAFPIQTKSIFIGLILGCIPSLIQDCNSKINFKFYFLFYTLFAFFIGIISVVAENYFSNSFTQENFSFLYLAFSGFAMSVGVIIPGVSSTIILMLLGVYSTYLLAVSTISFPILIPMGIGLVIGCIIFMIITKFLLNKFYAQTFYSIIGFSLGSIFVLLPNINSSFSLIISILCVCLGFLVSSMLKK